MLGGGPLFGINIVGAGLAPPVVRPSRTSGIGRELCTCDARVLLKPQLPLFQADVSLSADHHVVQDFDIQQLPRLDQ